MFIIKFFIYFTLSFIILSFPVGNKPIFSHLNKVAKPYTTELFADLSEKAKDNLQAGKEIGQKMFSTNIKKQDHIKTQYSSTQKAESKKIKRELKKEIHKDTYTPEEKELLQKIIEES
ncbi:hypothetical protein OAT67_00020 [Bacteriovoracaceae bacterium]|nr:hypothetical protein [Bacteriovoracaceae bacterium]|tara:strand:- start:299585 stop:299938 length:354 start_codon:yes stop_codon:yes gene_type:complete